MLTPEQTALLERAKALVDANPNDHTSTMELVRGLVGIVEDVTKPAYTISAGRLSSVWDLDVPKLATGKCFSCGTDIGYSRLFCDDCTAKPGDE